MQLLRAAYALRGRRLGGAQSRHRLGRRFHIRSMQHCTAPGRLGRLENIMAAEWHERSAHKGNRRERVQRRQLA